MTTFSETGRVAGRIKGVTACIQELADAVVV